MESGAIMKMVEYVFCHSYYIIDVIVRDNDSTMQDAIKNISIGSQGQVMRSSKGKLDKETPVPSFLAYPYHRVKVDAKNIFYIVKNGKAQRCGCTKADALRINRYWGCMINKNRRNIME